MIKRAILGVVSAVIISYSVAAAAEWDVQEKQSPIDDSPVVSMVLPANEPFKDLFGRDQWGNLVIGCIDHETSIGFWAGGEMINEKQDVIIRFDKTPAKTYVLNKSADYKLVGYRGKEAIPLIRKIAASKSVFARLMLESGNQADMTFDVSGLPALLPKVRAACEW